MIMGPRDNIYIIYSHIDDNIMILVWAKMTEMMFRCRKNIATP